MTEPEIVIRIAGLADVAAIARHRARMFQDMGELAAKEVPEFLATAADRLAEELTQGKYFGWLAQSADGRVVAGAGVQLRTLLPRPEDTSGKEALVLNVYVEPAFRRRGIARALMKEILNWCRAQGIRRVVLHASELGRPLYEKLGFEPRVEMIYRGTWRSSPLSPTQQTGRADREGVASEWCNRESDRVPRGQ